MRADRPVPAATTEGLAPGALDQLIDGQRLGRGEEALAQTLTRRQLPAELTDHGLDAAHVGTQPAILGAPLALGERLAIES